MSKPKGGNGKLIKNRRVDNDYEGWAGVYFLYKEEK